MYALVKVDMMRTCLSLQFGARMLRRVPVEYRGAWHKGPVEAEVWQVGPEEFKQMLPRLQQWEDQYSAQDYFHRPKSRRRIQAAGENSLMEIPGKPPEEKAAFLQRCADYSNEDRYVMTVARRPIGFIPVERATSPGTESPPALSVNYVMMAPWNVRVKPQQHGRFNGILEGLVYTALKQHPDLGITWRPINHHVKRLYHRLVMPVLGHKPHESETGKEMLHAWESRRLAEAGDRLLQMTASPLQRFWVGLAARATVASQEKRLTFLK